MPYRRLPKTDASRIEALRKITEIEIRFSMDQQPVDFKYIQKAKQLLPLFEDQVRKYQFYYSQQVSRSRVLAEKTRKARMYVSHFIQVLNMAIERGDIKRSKKVLYGLSEDNDMMPKLITDEELFTVGKKVIDGEMKRQLENGIPINFPTIHSVKIYYDEYTECRYNKKMSQDMATREQKNVAAMRAEIDGLILATWNEIETYFSNINDEDKRLAKCKECGVIYYLRKKEKERLTKKVADDEGKVKVKIVDSQYTLF